MHYVTMLINVDDLPVSVVLRICNFYLYMLDLTEMYLIMLCIFV